MHPTCMLAGRIVEQNHVLSHRKRDISCAILTPARPLSGTVRAGADNADG